MPAHPLDAPLHVLACDRHPQDREALAYAWLDGASERWSFGDVARASREVAAGLAEAGVKEGDRLAIVLPQAPLAPVVHLAASRLGAVAVPLSPLFGPDGLAPRLAASGAGLAVVHEERAAAVAEAAPGLPRWVARGRAQERPPPGLRARGGSARLPSPPRPGPGEAPLALLFTSGTTAEPKAALLPHRVVPGRMGGMALAHPGFPAPGDRFWSPADWAWIGGLYDSLFAPWAAGAPVFAYERRGPFDPARAALLLEQHGVRNAFLPPTAMRLWMRSGAPAPQLRTLHSAGEPLPPPVHAWAAKAFGTAPTEVYGLTECAYLLVNHEARPGVTGRPVPGSEVAVLRPDGAACAPDEEGEVAVRAGAPTMMLGYLRGGRLELPLDARGWLRTGDVATRDREGRVTVLGRGDDVVKTGGYRVAPREVEQELLRHPAVEECAVVGVPDELRGAVLHAFVRPAPGATPGDALAAELAAWVRERLAAHQVPRRFAFVERLPTTTSGKVLRRRLREDARP